MVRNADLNIGTLLSNLQFSIPKGHNVFNLSDTPALDAQVLLTHISGKSRAWLLAHPEAVLEKTQQQKLVEAIEKLAAGIPLPYVIGYWEFYNLDFTINPSVLIPRPETELIVEQAVTWLRQNPGRRKAADIGTGSGCIAISLAVHVPDLFVTATDISAEALKVAHANAQKHGVVDRIELIQDNLFNVEHSTFDVICANLPYIPTETLHKLDIFGREPTLALDGGPDGLNLIRRLLHDAPQYLAPGGLLLFEIEASQGGAASTLAREAFPKAQVHLQPDLAGHDRLVRVKKVADT